MALSHLLNFSRGVAALLVLLFHIRTTLVVPYENLETHGWLARAVFSISTFGHDAVIIFFVLSGYLVGGAVLRMDMASSRDLWDYGIDRGVRIGPVLIAATIFAIVLQHLMPLSGCADNAVTIVGNALALQNLAIRPLCNNLPLWSISNEVAYYFVFPVIVAVATRVFSTRLTLALTAVVLIGVLSVGLTPLDDTNIVIDVPFWLIGAALWFVPARFRRLRWLALLALAGALFFGRFEIGKTYFWLRDAYLAVAFSFLLVTFFNQPMPQASIRAAVAGRAAKWSRWLADISFSLYVTHYPLIKLYAYVALGSDRHAARYTSIASDVLLRFAVLGAVCILVAFCFSTLFEQPRRMFKDGIVRRLQRLQVY
ncbi:MAG TPA: acyltransferase [Pseudolabrys sp.]|nr:acyltransferase [Pseudolabrys sp.]